MESPDWLRTQLTSFTCPACGRRYRGSKMRLLAEREGLYFVDLDCSRCGSHTVAIVTVELDESEVTIAVSDVVGEDEIEHLGEALPTGAAPVTADDVLAMHEFLGRYHGTLTELLETGATGSSRPRSDGADRR
jgi:transcription elongation factor Elf1